VSRARRTNRRRTPRFASRAARLSALAAVTLAAACEHPLPSSGPTPRELMVAEYLDVPVSFIQAFEREGVRPPAGDRPRLDPASPEAVQLRKQLDLLQQAHPPQKRVKP
jgi:hypothetical protein